MSSDKTTLKGVVLCGGEGARLRPLTYYFPKVMVPIGRSQKPLLEYVVRLLAKHGVSNIVLLVGYKAEQIINYFGDGERFGLRLSYVHDRPGCEGTGGALLNAYEERAVSVDDELLIYYGDILSDIDLTKMLKEHRLVGASATLAIAKGYQIPVGTARIDERNRVLELVEKPTLDIAVAIAIMVLQGIALKDLEALAKGGKKKPDLMGDLVPALIKSGKAVNSYLHSSFWYDVASTERYEKLDQEIVDRLLDDAHHHLAQKKKGGT